MHRDNSPGTLRTEATMDSLEAAGTFVDWLRSSGGHFHESLEFRQGELIPV